MWSYPKRTHTVTPIEVTGVVKIEFSTETLCLGLRCPWLPTILIVADVLVKGVPSRHEFGVWRLLVKDTAMIIGIDIRLRSGEYYTMFDLKCLPEPERIG